MLFRVLFSYVPDVFGSKTAELIPSILLMIRLSFNSGKYSQVSVKFLGL